MTKTDSTSTSFPKAKKAGKVQATLPFLSVNTGPYLSACIKRWNLQAPFNHIKEDDTFWKNYYMERSLLEFRHEHAFDESGEVLPKADKKLQFLAKDIEEWKKISSSVKGEDAMELPGMPPICLESYASEGYHDSNTAKGEYLDYSKTIRQQVAKTLKDTNLPPIIKKSAANNVYILQYWINWEEPGDARTVEVTTRIYSPIGNGHSIDLRWERHFRRRFSCNGELFSSLRFAKRQTCDPQHPCQPEVSEESTTLANLSCENSYTEEEEDIRSSLGGASKMKKLATFLLGDLVAASVSKRKVFMLLARSSGAFHIGCVGSWIYKLIRERMELLPNEEDEDPEKEFDEYMEGW